MHVWRVLFILGIGICLLPRILAAEPTASWEGLTGLYTQPTAEILPPGDISFTFSELRFKQSNDIDRLENKWFTGSAAFSLFNRLKVAVTDRNEVLRQGPLGDAFPTRIDETMYLGHVKYVLAHPDRRKLGLAVGMLDITDETDRLDGVDLDRGRRLFLVGTYDWASLGVFQQDDNLGGFFGGRLALTDNIELIGELNSQPLFAHLTPEPVNRMNFNMGLRLHPKQVPQLRVDLAAIGDGQFDFGFSLSYNFSP